jgi:hypothetical protein
MRNLPWIVLWTSLCPGQTLAPTESRVSPGETITLEASAPFGANFQALAGLSGTWPGTPLPGGATLPLNLDWLSVQVCNAPKSFKNFCPGYVYDPGGIVPLTITVPALPSLVGLTLYVACVVHDGALRATNAATVQFVP